MSTSALHPQTAAQPASLRPVFFCALLLLFWITLDPLSDLSTDAVLGAKEGSSIFNQILYVSLFGICLAVLGHFGFDKVKPLLHPVLLATVGWFVLSSVLSVNAGLSVRRLGVTLIVMAIVGIMLLLPRDRREFETLLGGCALFVTILHFLAVIFFPHLAIHQADAILETNLAGSWRGLYDHKATTGPTMVLFVFIGLYLVGRGRHAIGMPLVVLAGLFLMFTGAKQPQALLPVVLAVTWLVSRMRSRFLIAGLLLGLLALYLTFTVGSVMIPAVADIDRAIMSDPTFTNRTGIWTYALGRFAERPVFGFGLHAFWNTEAVRFSDTTSQTSWQSAASDSHNAYLDLALTTGLPGLAFAALALVVLPIRDYWEARRIPENAPTALLFLRIWMFAVFAGAMETIFFQRDNGFWVTFLIAIFGLRYLTAYRLKPRS